MLLDDGVLLEAGTHDELVALNGEYKKRWELFIHEAAPSNGPV
jgi:ABC-type multidrug transport system fused ATPase/permease subunit